MPLAKLRKPLNLKLRVDKDSWAEVSRAGARVVDSRVGDNRAVGNKEVVNRVKVDVDLVVANNKAKGRVVNNKVDEDLELVDKAVEDLGLVGKTSKEAKVDEDLELVDKIAKVDKAVEDLGLVGKTSKEAKVVEDLGLVGKTSKEAKAAGDLVLVEGLMPGVEMVRVKTVDKMEADPTFLADPTEVKAVPTKMEDKMLVGVQISAEEMEGKIMEAIVVLVTFLVVLGVEGKVATEEEVDSVTVLTECLIMSEEVCRICLVVDQMVDPIWETCSVVVVVMVKTTVKIHRINRMNRAHRIRMVRTEMETMMAEDSDPLAPFWEVETVAMMEMVTMVVIVMTTSLRNPVQLETLPIPL